MLKIAIVGRPNVGKSAFFNKLVGKPKALVDFEAGTTRDFNISSFIWQRNTFEVMDTGGVLFSDVKATQQIPFQKEIETQVTQAMDFADIIWFVVDGKAGLTPQDEIIAQAMRKTKKPVWLVVNKLDNHEQKTDINDFYSLGFEMIFGVSAVHGIGVADLLENLVKLQTELKASGKSKLEPDHGFAIPIAIVGKPNVGKSSLFNLLAKSERSIVSPTAGTTRDCVDTLIHDGDTDFLIVDTAGIRKQNKVEGKIEHVAVSMAENTIARSAVCLFVFDASQPLNDQDLKIAGKIEAAGRACILVGNKWDLLPKDNDAFQEFEEHVRSRLKFLSYAPLLLISATEQKRTHQILPMVKQVYEAYHSEINTKQLNNHIEKWMTLLPPPVVKGKRLKIKFTKQVQSAPPTLVSFVNDPKSVHFSYRRYLENKLREQQAWQGCPVLWAFRRK
jgi:GTP-binding protein